MAGIGNVAVGPNGAQPAVTGAAPDARSGMTEGELRSLPLRQAVVTPC